MQGVSRRFALPVTILPRAYVLIATMRSIMKDTKKKLRRMLGFSFLALLPSVHAAYNTSLLANEWFNTDILVTNTTAGVFFYFFIFIVYVGMIVLSEHVKMPAIMFLSGMLGFFIGFLFYVIISAVIGVIFIVIAMIYMIRSIIFLRQ